MKTKGSLRRISEEMSGKIYEYARLNVNREKPREELAHELRQRFGVKSPSLQTLMRMISKARNKPPTDLDNPWTIGCCIKYKIPSDIISSLIEVKRASDNFGGLNITNDLTPQIQKAYAKANKELKNSPTIRQARWFARLYQSLDAVIEEKGLPPPKKLAYHFIVAAQYAQKEQISEMLNREYPDTSDLDKLYFIDKELDTLEGLLINHFTPEDLASYRQWKKEGEK
jgi:hypothetical protein